MSLGTNRITSFGHQAVYTVPAGKRATVNATVHANSAAPLVGIAANALGSYPSSTAVTDPAALFYSDTGTTTFGSKLATDGNYAVISSGASGTSLVRVYFFNGTAWTLQQTITDPNTSGNVFGASVDISGDRILVGAPNNSQTTSNEGRAYLYTRSGTTWTLSFTYTKPGVSQNQARFGTTVAFGGTTVYIGAPGDVTNSVTCGSVSSYTTYTTYSSSFFTNVLSTYASGDGLGQTLIAWPNGIWAASSPGWSSGRGAIIFGNFNTILGQILGPVGTATYALGSVLVGNTKSTNSSTEAFWATYAFLPSTIPTGINIYGFFSGSPIGGGTLLQTLSPTVNHYGTTMAMRANGDLLTQVPVQTSSIYTYARNSDTNTWSLSATLSSSKSGVTSSNFAGSSIAASSLTGTSALGNSWTVNTIFTSNTSAATAYIFGNPVTAASVADSNAFVSSFGTDRTTLSANQTFERTGIVMDAGESLVVANLGGGDILAQVRGYEENV